MTKKEDVHLFLDAFKVKLGIWGVVFRDGRPKNAQTLLDLELSVKDRKAVLEKLKVEDYAQGPLEEKLYGGNDMWVFGVQVKGVELYIKISIGMQGQQVLCISFHKAEAPIVYPFKKM